MSVKAGRTEAWRERGGVMVVQTKKALTPSGTWSVIGHCGQNGFYGKRWESTSLFGISIKALGKRQQETDM